MILGNISVFSAMVKNFSSDAMNRGMIGYTISRDFGPFTHCDFDEYASTTNDDPVKYSPAESPAPPFFFSKHLYPMFKKIITHDDLKLDILRMVQGYQGLNCFDQIVKGDCVRIEMVIDDITETVAGEILKIVTRGYRDGGILFEADTGFIVRRRRHRESPRKGMRIVETLSMDHRACDMEIPVYTRRGQERKYAKISGDTTPVHTNRIFARIAGFPCTIMQSICVMAMCTNSLIDACAGRDNRKLRAVSGRFTSPVYPGDTLTLIGSCGRRGKFKEVNFTLYSPAGEAVINKGYFSCSE